MFGHVMQRRLVIGIALVDLDRAIIERVSAASGVRLRIPRRRQSRNPGRLNRYRISACVKQYPAYFQRRVHRRIVRRRHFTGIARTAKTVGSRSENGPMPNDD